MEFNGLYRTIHNRIFNKNDYLLIKYSFEQIQLHVAHVGECELGATKKANSTSSNDSHKDESVEAGVRLINDEENEDEFNVILRQQSAEDESSVKKQSSNASTKDGGKNQAKSQHIGHHHNSTHSTYHKHHHHHNQSHHKHHRKQHSSKHNQPINRKQRNQLCRKLNCRFGAVCKLDQTNLNESKLNITINESDVERNRISLEVTAYCDCDINCDLTDFRKDDKPEELCASDGKLYNSECQMKEKSCKLQMNIQPRQRNFCDSKQIDSNVIKANESTPGRCFFVIFLLSFVMSHIN